MQLGIKIKNLSNDYHKMNHHKMNERKIQELSRSRKEKERERILNYLIS